MVVKARRCVHRLCEAVRWNALCWRIGEALSGVTRYWGVRATGTPHAADRSCLRSCLMPCPPSPQNQRARDVGQTRCMPTKPTTANGVTPPSSSAASLRGSHARGYRRRRIGTAPATRHRCAAGCNDGSCSYLSHLQRTYACDRALRPDQHRRCRRRDFGGCGDAAHA